MNLNDLYDDPRTPQEFARFVGRKPSLRDSLYESVTPVYSKQFLLGESLGRTLVEAKLTPDQINQLFAEIEAGAAAGGGNRTALGKITDAGKLVKQAYGEIKELAQTSGPVQGFDAAFAKGAQSLGQALGGDQGVMKYINKYREFAKAHPTAQKVVYGTLVLAIGVSAAMTGPAALAYKPAILGIMKMTDKLLQGEQFSSAAIAGGETFAAGEIAKTVGGWVKGLISTGSAAPVDVQSGGGSAAGDAATQEPSAGGKRGAARFGASPYSVDQNAAGLEQGRDLAQKMGLPPNSEIKTMGGVPIEIGGKPVPNELLTPSQAGDIEAQRKMAIQMGNPDPLAGRPAYTGSVAAITPAKDIPDTGTSKAPKWIQDAAAKAGVNADDAEFGMKHPGVDAKSDLAAAKAGLDTPQGVQAVTGGGNILQPPVDIKGDPTLSKAYTDLIAKIQNTPDYNARNLPNDISNRLGLDQRQSSALSLIVQKQGGGSMQGFLDSVKGQAPGVRSGATSTTGQFESQFLNKTPLTEATVTRAILIVEAGMWDKVKQGAAAAGSAIAGSKAAQVVGQGVAKGIQKAAQVGSNLTNKVTADKLMGAWVKAGKPDDSEAVKKIMVDAGADAQVVDAALQKLGVAGATGAADIEPMKAVIAKMSQEDRAKLIADLEKELGAQPVSENAEQGYHVKNNKVYGKVLAYNGQTVIANHEKAMELADKYNGSLLKSMDGKRFIIKVSEAPPTAVKENKADPELDRLMELVGKLNNRGA